MSKRFANTSFWLITLATVVGMAVTASLGRWQLGRAAQKEAHAAQVQARSALPPLGWEELSHQGQPADWSEWHERRVQLQGRWRNEDAIFLDNRPLNGRAGYWLLTPMQPVDGQAPAVLVLRAWVPRSSDDRRSEPHLPELMSKDGLVTVQGRLTPPPSKLYELGPEAAVRVRQNVEMAGLAQEWQLPLLPVAVLQTGGDELPAGWSRDWPVPNVDVHKHYGYAVQWFGLCTLMAVLYVWFQFIAPRRRV